MKNIKNTFFTFVIAVILVISTSCSGIINPSLDFSFTLDTPSNVSAKSKSSYNKITWDSVNKADYYYIYRNTNNNSSTAIFLNTTTGTSYTDYSKDIYSSYYYWVVAYNSTKKVYSAYSVSAYCESYYTPADYGDFSYVPADAINYCDYISDTLYTPVHLEYSPEYIYFYAQKNKSYSVKWADRLNGYSFITENSDYGYNELVDVKVKCFVAGDPDRITSQGFEQNDDGYSYTQTFTADYTGYYILEVSPYYSGETGWWALKVSEISY